MFPTRGRANSTRKAFYQYRFHDHPPVSSPLYRLSPQKKELLKKEIDELLEKNIIEECESSYAAPVILIP